VRRQTTRPQRTIVHNREVRGVGLLTGADVGLRLLPAPPSTGVVFVRTDLPGRPRIPAQIDQVTGTNRRTTIGRPPAQVTLIEHVLAALTGLRIDNCIVELDAPEPPGLDGSSRGFVEVLLEAGVVNQPAVRGVWRVDQPVTVQAPGVSLTLHPPEEGIEGLTMSYFLDYGPGSPIGRQLATHQITPGVFIQDLAECRTFLLLEEAEELRRQGLGARTTTADLLVFGPRGPIENKLRHGNEPARHKVLDMIGDLSLLGVDLCGHVVACRSGHPLNIELARSLHQRLLSAQARAAVA